MKAVMMKKAMTAALAVSFLGLFATEAMAQEQSPWLVRVRAVHIDPADKSDPIPALGVTGSDAISVSSKTIPEIDISYFFTPNIAAELVLTYPQKHDVMLNGANIGSFKHVPPTLLAQYHFMPEAQFSPYLGAGVNYTNISSVHLLGGAATMEHKSFGFALQAGLDYKIDKNWSLNLDIKKVQIGSDVMLSGTGQKVTEVKVDPILIGIGIGYRF
jgi:outer membrane protein